MTRTLAAAIALTCLAANAAAADAADPVRPETAATADVTSAPPVANIDWAFSPTLDAPKRGGLLPALYVGLAGLNVYDAYSTSNGLSSGAREANPMMKGIAGNSAALWAVKGGVTAASIAVAERLWRHNRRAAAITTMVISNGMMAIVAANNARAIGRR